MCGCGCGRGAASRKISNYPTAHSGDRWSPSTAAVLSMSLPPSIWLRLAGGLADQYQTRRDVQGDNPLRKTIEATRGQIGEIERAAPMRRTPAVLPITGRAFSYGMVGRVRGTGWVPMPRRRGWCGPRRANAVVDEGPASLFAEFRTYHRDRIVVMRG